MSSNNKETRDRLATVIVDRMTSDQIRDCLIDAISEDLLDEITFTETLNEIKERGEK
mgnify:CR=1 FL=1